MVWSRLAYSKIKVNRRKSAIAGQARIQENKKEK
jgi:hypothetical protein